jgi:lysophospholipid acyltransferase
VGFFLEWTVLISSQQGAAIVTGLGFSGYDQSGRSIWTGAANVDILAIEIPSGFKGLIDAWNMKTNVWLRECVYKRVTPTGKKPGFMSSMLTFLTSAFWVSRHHLSGLIILLMPLHSMELRGVII